MNEKWPHRVKEIIAEYRGRCDVVGEYLALKELAIAFAKAEEVVKPVEAKAEAGESWGGLWQCESCGKSGGPDWYAMVTSEPHGVYHYYSDDIPECRGRLVHVERRTCSAPAEGLRVFIGKDDDGYYVEIDGPKKAAIWLGEHGPIVMDALESAYQSSQSPAAPVEGERE